MCKKTILTRALRRACAVSAAAPKVKPGNAWTELATPTVQVEPRDKIAALKALVESLPENAPHGRWFRNAVTVWAASTGSSLESVLGLKRSGIPGPHQQAHQANRDDAIRHIARALPGKITDRAHRIAAIVRGESPAPAKVLDLVEDLMARYGDDVPRSPVSYFRILKDK